MLIIVYLTVNTMWGLTLNYVSMLPGNSILNRTVIVLISSTNIFNASAVVSGFAPWTIGCIGMLCGIRMQPEFVFGRV